MLTASMHDTMDQSNLPVVPLPNVGEGGPVYDGEASPAPDPVPGIPVVPLPNPGEGGPVQGGSRPCPGCIFPGLRPLPPLPPAGGYGTVRFLNAAYKHPSFRIFTDHVRRVNFLNYTSLSPYTPISAGYHTITVAGPDGYIYLQKSLPFHAGSKMTVAVINRAGGLDLLAIPDLCCPPGPGYSNFRVSNLARSSRPLDVLLADGRTVYADVRFKETTSSKRIRPGAYEFLFADTSQLPMPISADIETLDSAFLGVHPVPGLWASLTINIRRETNYTVFILSSSGEPYGIQTIVAEDR